MFPKIDLLKIYYQSSGDGGAGNGESKSEDNQEQQGEPETFESYLSKLPDEQKKVIEPLFQAHVAKLTNTVKATRQERNDFEKKLNDAIKKAEKGSELETQLQTISKDLDAANRRSEFYEQAPTFECRNAKAAYAVAVSNDLFTKTGAPDWQAIQKEAPELFGKLPPRAPQKKTAGNGTNQEPTTTSSMNDFIRRSAGRMTTE